MTETSGTRVMRVLRTRQHFKKGQALPEAFLPYPNRDTGRLETSCADATGLDDSAKQAIEDEVHERIGGPQSLRGRAEFDARVLDRTSPPLRWERDDHPFDRHGVVLGWSEERAVQMLAAQEIAAVAETYPRPQYRWPRP